ncbi:hypothetical protein AB6C79_09565 [Vibrio splendidus]
MTYRNKHVFIIPRKDVFFSLHVDSLINKVGVDPNSICAIFISEDEDEVIVGYPGVEYINSQSVVITDLVESSSITSFSLGIHNSSFVSSMFRGVPNIVELFYIYITDDELDRWDKVHSEFGKLKKTVKQGIDENVLYVLSKVNKFIAIKSIHHEVINKVIGREVYFFDVSCLFNILPSAQHENVINSLEFEGDSKVKRVLFHSKGLTRGKEDVEKLLEAYSSFDKTFNGDVHFLVYIGNRRTRRWLSLRLFILSVINKKPLRIDVLNHTDKYTYMSQVMTCDFMILQPRGGASTARTLLKSGRGMVCVYSKSKNAKSLSEGFKVPVIEGDSYQEMADLAYNGMFDQRKAVEALSRAELDAVEKYREFYFQR